jgi:hypothetical protein
MVKAATLGIGDRSRATPPVFLSDVEARHYKIVGLVKTTLKPHEDSLRLTASSRMRGLSPRGTTRGDREAD